MLLFPETSVVTDQCSPSANSTNLAKLLTCVRWKGLRRRLRCRTCFETNTLGEGVKGEGVKSTNETLTPTWCLAILWTAHPVSLHLWSLMPIVTVGTLQNGTFLQLDQLIHLHQEPQHMQDFLSPIITRGAALPGYHTNATTQCLSWVTNSSPPNLAVLLILQGTALLPLVENCPYS